MIGAMGGGHGRDDHGGCMGSLVIMAGMKNHAIWRGWIMAQCRQLAPVTSTPRQGTEYGASIDIAG